MMLKMKVLGNYAPNLKGLPGSCYLLTGLEKIILLDLGNGNIKSLLKEIKKDDIENLIVVLSHNHLDHSYDILKLAKILKKWNKKIKLYLPKRSMIYYLVKSYYKVFEVNVITEKTKIYLENAVIDFCQTFHSGESYATRIKINDEKSEKTNIKIFVYTSDVSYVSIGLKYFCNDADVVLIDSGIPLVNKFHLKGYHGITSEILNELFSNECTVKRVLASHVKACLGQKCYINMFPKGKNVNLVKMDNEYEIFD